MLDEIVVAAGVDEDWSIVDYGGDVMIVVYHYHSTTAECDDVCYDTDDDVAVVE